MLFRISCEIMLSVTIVQNLFFLPIWATSVLDFKTETCPDFNRFSRFLGKMAYQAPPLYLLHKFFFREQINKHRNSQMAIFMLSSSFRATGAFEFLGSNLGKDTDILSVLHCKYHYKRILK